MLILIRGLPGSGKTWLAQALMKGCSAEGFNSIHFEADQYFERDGVYKYDSKEIGKAHQVCQKKTKEALDLPFDFIIVANTFSQMWEMKPYIAMAQEKNVPFTILETRGSFGSIHDVPQEKIEKMKKRWQKLSLDSLEAN